MGLLIISDVRTSLDFDSYRVGLGDCWNCILTQSVNFTVVLITTLYVTIFCPLPFCSAQSSSRAALAFRLSLLNYLPILLLLLPPVLILYYWNNRLIKHQVINQASKVCGAICVRDGSQCSLPGVQEQLRL
jgi:hypothetical protein